MCVDSKSVWYETTELSDHYGCDGEHHCSSCEPDGNCESCDTIDGRFMEEVNTYASTCDWCGELTCHDTMKMDEDTQLGACEVCVEKFDL